jgi:hypothetical protein
MPQYFGMTGVVVYGLFIPGRDSQSKRHDCAAAFQFFQWDWLFVAGVE